jgi:hypothetical protein
MSVKSSINVRFHSSTLHDAGTAPAAYVRKAIMLVYWIWWLKVKQYQLGWQTVPEIQDFLENSSIIRHPVKYRRSDGTEVASHQQKTLHFSMERGMKIIN